MTHGIFQHLKCATDERQGMGALAATNLETKLSSTLGFYFFRYGYSASEKGVHVTELPPTSLSQSPQLSLFQSANSISPPQDHQSFFQLNK